MFRAALKIELQLLDTALGALEIAGMVLGWAVSWSYSEAMRTAPYGNSAHLGELFALIICSGTAVLLTSASIIVPWMERRRGHRLVVSGSSGRVVSIHWAFVHVLPIVFMFWRAHSLRHWIRDSYECASDPGILKYHSSMLNALKQCGL